MTSTYDPRKPARERTPFGNFQLHQSHLKTGTIRVPYAEEKPVAADVRRAAALTVCDRAVDVAEAAKLLDLLGLLP